MRVQNMGTPKLQMFPSFLRCIYSWQSVPTHCGEISNRTEVLILPWKHWTFTKTFNSEFAKKTVITGEINRNQMLNHGKLGTDQMLNLWNEQDTR